MSGTHPAFSSHAYWEARYAGGGNSGAGSYGRLARFKADFINNFVANNAVTSLIEFGCGDGAQLALLDLPRYIGVDVSPTALTLCQEKNGDRPGFSFFLPADLEQAISCEVALSHDVIFHLVEDATFERHIHDLFLFATRFVVIYSSNYDKSWSAQHVRHRHVTKFVAARHPEWQLAAVVPNPYPFDPADTSGTSFSDYYIFVPSDRTRTVSISTFVPDATPER